jgi:RNA polymerase sigma factor (sigma-70 family)
VTLEDLLKEYESKIQTIARKMVRSYWLSREDHEDLCSAMRMRLVTHYSKVDFARPEAGAYVYSIITNAARTYLMKSIIKHKDHMLSLDAKPSFDDGSEGESLADLIPDPKSINEEQISFNAVRDEVLSRLKPKHRKMVEMHLAGITSKEIAERVLHKNGRKFTPQTVAWIVQGFRAKLKARMEGKRLPVREYANINPKSAA